MVLPNGSATSGSNTWPTFTPPNASGEFPLGMEVDQDGHVKGSLPAWGLVIPPAAVGASKVYFDLHNASANVLRLRKLFAIVATDVSVTGTLGVRLDCMRTSTVGTGGTAAATTASTSKTAAGFWPFTPGGTLTAGITARVTPTGGATDEQWLWPSYVFTEETNMSSHFPQFFNLLPEMFAGQSVELTNGKGLKVVQGAVASVGSVGFLVCFTIE